MKGIITIISVVGLTAMSTLFGGCSSKGTSGVTAQPAPTGVTAHVDRVEPAPNITSSIQVPPKADEATLARLAKITAEQARATALTKVSGTVVSVELEGENGILVYSVEIKTPTNKQEVKIDAGNGQVLKVETANSKEVGEHGRKAVESGTEGKDKD